MRLVQLTATADANGELHLTIPAEVGAEFDVDVALQPRTPGQPRRPTPEELGWPPGYFENVIGSIDDPAFKRYPQGEPQVRESFE